MNRIIRKRILSAPSLPNRQKVAAYARVSSGKDAMLQSRAAQIRLLQWTDSTAA